MEFLDWCVVALYGGIVLLIGSWAGRPRPGTVEADEYLLGGRTVPTGAVLFSLMATELSAATFVGVPASACQSLAWFYLQFGVGSILARLLLARAIIPLYHRRGVRTVYQFIGQRFGEGARQATAATFVLGRLLASSVRLYIAAFAATVVLGSGIELTILCCGLLAAIYAVRGGIRAVIWTDALQGVVLLLGALVAIGTVGRVMPGGFSAIFDWATQADAFRWIDLPTSSSGSSGDLESPWWIEMFTTSTNLVAALFGGFFLTLATHSTDHDMVQRLLSARGGAEGGRALAWSGLLNIPVVILFLFLGTSLAALNATSGFVSDTEELKWVFPIFIREVMTTPWSGLVMAGLFAAAMSSLDSAICAIGATWSNDLRKRDSNEAQLPRDERHRSTAFVFALLLIGGAIGFSIYEQLYANPKITLVEVALSAMTVVYGALLGVFATGFISRRGTSRRAVAALVVGVSVGMTLFMQPVWLGETMVAWPWWIPISATVSGVIVFVGSQKREEIGDAFSR